MSEKQFSRAGKKFGGVLQNPGLDSKPRYTMESPCQLKIQIPTFYLGIFTSVIKLIMLTIQI